MTAPLLIASALVALYATLKAGNDVMNDRWEQSVFHRWSGGDRDAYWGHRDYVWMRRYEEGDPDLKKRPVFRIPVVGHALEAVWDGWHLLSTLRLLCFIVGLVVVPALPLWALLALWGLYFVTFELFYRRVWT